MEYNWGDPKKNSLLSFRMMAKAEITRKKRLTNVKSTLSNQLHPAIEHKLRKTKKASNSAQHLNLDSCSNDMRKTQVAESPFASANNEPSSLDTVCHDIPTPVSACASNRSNVSMFDEFSLNAAADGLFHPASTVQAFTEHDARYHQEIQSRSDKSRSRPRRARSGSEYPPSRESQRLPALHSNKAKRGRLTPRHTSKLLPASTSGSAPASMTSSFSKLLDADETQRNLSAIQSDSRLYTTLSTADENALDFLERDLRSNQDNNSPLSPVPMSSLITPDNNERPDDLNGMVPSLDLSLVRKFDELKRVLESNRAKHNSARQSSEEQDGNRVSPGKSVSGQPALSSRTASGRKDDRKSVKSAIRAPSSGSSQFVKGGLASKVKGAVKKRSTPAACATNDMNNNASSFKRAPATGATTRKKTAIAIAPVRSKKGANVRSGVSLSDLKAEHLEALQMLKELGGPVDLDYLEVHTDSNALKTHQHGRSVTRPTRVNHSMLSFAETAAVQRKCSNQSNYQAPTLSPPTSANSGSSLVTKLRESISSASREPSLRLSCSADSLTMVSERKQMKRKSTDASTASEAICNMPLSSSQVPIQGATGEVIAALDQVHVGKAKRVYDDVSKSSVLLPSTQAANAPDPWKQYKEDFLNIKDEHQERDGSSVKGDHYSDEDFESDK